MVKKIKENMRKGELLNRRFLSSVFQGSKGIGPVVATALLLIVAVVAVIGFQGWFTGYQSTLNTQVESRGGETFNTGIETMIGNTIFIKNNYDNLSILSVKVDGKECDVPSYILSGMRPLNISGCIDYDNLSTDTPEIVVVTDKGIMSKYVYVKDANVVYNPTSTLTGQFIDSAVEGLTYSTPSQNGNTNSNGEFLYMFGEMISFYVSDIYLGTTTAKPIITPADLGGGIDSQYTVNLARFLQSSDNDGNLANGINISQLVLDNSIGQTLNFSLSTAEFETIVNQSIVNLTVNENDAIIHLVNSIAEIESSMPNAFSFTNQNGVELDTITYSNTLTPTGYYGSLSVSIIGDGSPQLSINGGSFVTNGKINSGDNLTIRLTSANDYGITNNAVLTLGDYSTIWSITTKQENTVILGICEGLSGDWVEVPADGYFTTNNFCVMKYEAKNVGGIATSQAANNPWVSITFTNSRTECSNIGTGYRLITNKQWMTIARDFESNPNNWADGNVGSLVSNGGGLFRGNVNLNDAVSCGTSTVLDGNTAGTNCLISGGIHDGRNKRTLELSNGELIWDFSGNVWQWVDAMEDGTSLATGTACSGGSNWYSFVGNDGKSECSFDQSNPAYRKTNANDKRFEMGPFGNYNADNGIGRIYSSTSTLRALLRGGPWNFGAYAGPFAAYLTTAPSYTSANFGFRCVYEP